MDPSLPGVDADGAVVQGDVFLRCVTATDEVRFYSAKIGGNLFATGATFTGQPNAFDAQGAELDGTLSLRDVTATGSLWLSHARVGGSLELSGAQVTVPSGFAVIANGAKVTGGVFLHPFATMKRPKSRLRFPPKAGLISPLRPLAGFTPKTLRSRPARVVRHCARRAL